MTQRNKANTRERLLSAVGEQLAEVGFSGLGVNAVAKRAGVDKVLIYRYFGDFDGLCKQFAESSDFWPSLEELIPDPDEFLRLPLQQRLAQLSRRFTGAIRSRPLTLEAMAWETIERNAFTIELERVREHAGLELNQWITRDLPDSSGTQSAEIDWLAVTAVFAAATHYLAIRARKTSYFNGIDISSEAGWERLESTMLAMLSGLLKSQD